MDARSGQYVKVGIFVTLGLITAAALIFVIGDERHMFTRKVILHYRVSRRRGPAPGWTGSNGRRRCGRWSRLVRFSNDPRDPVVHVDFQVVDEALSRVRMNSVVHIASKGLLGDKALDVTIGDPTLPQAPNGTTLRGEDSDEIGDAMRNATQLLDHANRVVDNIVTATRPLANEQLGNDVIAMAHNLRTITNEIATGNGTAGRLLRDETMANQVQGTLASAQGAIRDLQGTIGQVEAIARDARTGNGMVHSLIYDEQGGHAVASMGSAANDTSLRSLTTFAPATAVCTRSSTGTIAPKWWPI